MTTVRPIRTTLLGSLEGIFAWTDEDIRGLRARVEANENLWQAYLKAEAENGFITNAMNGELVDVAHQMFPDLEKKKFPDSSGNQLQALVVDFRFKCFDEFQFELWLPNNLNRRNERFNLHLKSEGSIRRSVHRNGYVEWRIEQVDRVIEYLQTTEPHFWRRYLWRMDEIGFIGHLYGPMILRQAILYFALPRDLDSGTILGAVMLRTTERYQHRMRQPENKPLRHALERDYTGCWANDQKTFDEWLEESPLVKQTIRTPQPE